MRVTFPTPIGRCALRWNATGLTGFELPEAAEQRTDERVPSPEIAALIKRVHQHLAGEPQDFSAVRYDFGAMPEFQREVLRATLEVKSGRTATYGEIAVALNQPLAASRAVGAALGANPWPLLIPCHRIVAANGKMTGFSGPGGVATKVKLLAIEGAQLL